MIIKIRLFLHSLLYKHRIKEVTRYYGEPVSSSTYLICHDCGYKGYKRWYLKI